MTIGIDRAVAAALVNASLIISGGSIAYVILKYQLLDVRLIARKGLFYAVTAAVFALFYLIIIKQFTRIYPYIYGDELEFVETLLIVLFIIAFQPVLMRLEEWTEKALMREQSPRVKLQNLSNELLYRCRRAIDEGEDEEGPLRCLPDR